MRSDFALNLLVGRTIEQAVKDAVRERYSVVDTGAIATAGAGGPRMEDAGNGVVLADLQLYRGPRAGWLEIKSKSKANHYRRFDIQEHGIDYRKAVEYYRLQRETAQPVYLLICELAGGEMLMQALDTLIQPKFYRKQIDPQTGILMINWDRGMFAKVGAFAVPGDDLRRVSVQIDWAQFETFLTQPMLLEEETTR
jgi:hypothetical protein